MYTSIYIYTYNTWYGLIYRHSRIQNVMIYTRYQVRVICRWTIFDETKLPACCLVCDVWLAPDPEAGP